MKALLALAAVVAGLAAAPTALAATQPTGYRFVTDTLGGNGHPKAAPGYRFITENSASQNGLGRPKAAPGYRFITDTLGGNGGVPVTVVAPAGFRWSDAGIGASAAVGAMLLLLGGSFLVLRRHGRLAF